MGFQTYTCAICGESGLSRRNTYALPDGKGRACRSHEESQAANNERIAKRDQAIADAVKKSGMDLKGFKTGPHTPHEHKDLDYLNKLCDLYMIGLINATMVHLILRVGFNFLEDKRKQPTPWMDQILDQLRDYSKRSLAAKCFVDESTFLRDVKHVINDGLKHYKEVEDSPRKDFSEIPKFVSEVLSMKMLIHTEIAADKSTEDISTVIEHRFNKLSQMVADALVKYSNSKDEFSLQWQMLTDLAELLWTLSHETTDSESDEPSAFIKTFAWANSVKKALAL